jgi:hypothetical protein
MWAFFWIDSDQHPSANPFARAALALFASFGLWMLALLELLLSPAGLSPLFDVLGVLSLTSLLYLPALSFVFAPLMRLSQRAPLASSIVAVVSLLIGAALLSQAKSATTFALSFVALYLASLFFVAPRFAPAKPERAFAIVFTLHLISAALFVARYEASFATRASIIKDSKLSRASTAFSGRLLGALNFGVKELADSPKVASLPPSQISYPNDDPKKVKYRTLNGAGQIIARNNPWKLTLNLTYQYAELYNLETDPDELHNLIDEHRDIGAAITRQILLEFVK